MYKTLNCGVIICGATLPANMENIDGVDRRAIQDGRIFFLSPHIKYATLQYFTTSLMNLCKLHFLEVFAHAESKYDIKIYVPHHKI